MLGYTLTQHAYCSQDGLLGRGRGDHMIRADSLRVSFVRAARASHIPTINTYLGWVHFGAMVGTVE